MRKKFTPECCSLAINSGVIHLYIPMNFDEEKSLPEWSCMMDDSVWHMDRELLKSIKPQFCPFCSKPLPKIRKRDIITEPTYLPKRDCYEYCITCDEPPRRCNCLPQEFNYEIIS